jgi:hypothetical protein
MVDDLVSLPKAHLHLHLVGAMRPTTLAELAAEAGVPVPDVTGDVGGWRRFSARYEMSSRSFSSARSTSSPDGSPCPEMSVTLRRTAAVEDS